jgi:hypothetical protein
VLVFDTEPAAIIDAFRDYAHPAAKWQARPVIRVVAALVQDESRAR